ncbi:MAG: hypothetical protein K2Q18_15875, partial [Bdellovibrionales bacterium]|nr:hypothetical protein [Bdellovibrionales bacterium]
MKRNQYLLMPLTFALVSTLVLTSCAGPESYQSKVEKIKPKQYGINQVPEINSVGFEFSKAATAKRGPASATVEKPTTVGEMATDDAALSNKKLYFLTLFGQYESMKKYSSQFDAPAVNICPHFHNSLLEHKGKKQAGFAGHITNKNNKKFVYDDSKLNDP